MSFTKYQSIDKLLQEPDRIQYLKNDICNFRFLNPKHYGGKKKKNLLTMSFFKMDKHYKNFDIYMTGLDRWIADMKFLHKTGDPNAYVIRMFIDQNIYQDQKIMRKILSSRYIEPVLFTCHNYMKGDFHIGVFATLLRFFPAFDFPNNDSNKVLSVDIDFDRLDLRIRKPSIKEDHMMGMVSIVEFLYYKTQPHVFAGHLYTGSPKKKYDQNIILDFIKDPNVSRKTRTNIDYGPGEKYSYGIDEIFLNNFWIDHVDKVGYTLIYTPAYFLFYSKDRIMKKSYSEDVFRQILGKYYQPSMSLMDMYQFFDNTFFEKRKFDAKAEYLAERFYATIAELLRKRKYWFEKRIMELVLREFNNVVSAKAVFMIDNQTHQYTVKLYDVWGAPHARGR